VGVRWLIKIIDGQRENWQAGMTVSKDRAIICQGRRKNDRDRMRVRTGCQFVRGKRKMVGIEFGTYRRGEFLHRKLNISTSGGPSPQVLCQGAWSAST